MARTEHAARESGSVELVFASDEPCTLAALHTLAARHTDEIERLGAQHDARATVQASELPTLSLSLSIEHGGHAGPACELEALAAVHDLEISLAGEGFALRQLRCAA
jgi:hypothetical protein